MLSRLKTSHSTVVAYLALFVALGGTAYASGLITGADIKNGSIAAKDLKKNAVNTSKVKNRSLLSKDFKAGQLPRGATGPTGATGEPGPQGQPGEKGDPGTDGTNGAIGATGPAGPGARWALINKNHDRILAQSGGISIAATGLSGTYLNMGADVNGKNIQATNAYTDDDPGLKGSTMALICGGQYAGTCGVSGTNNTHHVWVFTQNAANTLGENHAFYVAVF